MCSRMVAVHVNTPFPRREFQGAADLREYIDQGVWAISAVYTYLAVTGDTSLLSEQVGYQQVCADDPKAMHPTEEKDSVLEHLIRIMDYLSRQRDPETGLVLAMYGDWNDAIDGLGLSPDSTSSFGTGVSVMTSLQFYRNCLEMSEILALFAAGRFTKQGNHYHQLSQQLLEGLKEYAVVSHDDEQRIVHGWGDHRSYFVGSFYDCDGQQRDGLTSNAFWVLSGVLREDPSMREHLIAALERLDSPFGLKTFEPGFGPEAQGVGRIIKMPIGSAENGAAYLHATTFGIAALFQIGEPQKAWEQIAKIVPFAPHHQELSHSPFVMPNSYAYNPELNLTGQSMDDWQTGSSNVLLKLLIRHVFGFEPTLSTLRIAPAQWFPFEAFEFQGVAHGREVKITYQRDKVASRQVYLNGELLSTEAPDELSGIPVAAIPYAALDADAANEVRVVDPL